MSIRKKEKMFKKTILTIIFILLAMPVFPANLGNNINSNEFPMSENVLPNVNVNPDFVISGSIEKNIDMSWKRRSGFLYSKETSVVFCKKM